MIESLEQYQAEEARMKELLASFSGSGDLMDADEKGLSKDEGNWQGVSEKIRAIREDMKAYRAAHPEDF